MWKKPVTSRWFFHSICKNYPYDIALILSNKFNKTFETRTFPNHIKIPIVLPILKSRSRLEVLNYRPVSVLPIFE